jgi:ubiquinone/menaquinone biosynthesis C-methylase UbiE
MDAAGVKAFFDHVAGDWDAMRLTYYDERVIEQLAARTQRTGEQTVADVGTGTRFVAAGLAAHAGRVLGCDNAPSTLEVARANLDRLGIDNVEHADIWLGFSTDQVEVGDRNQGLSAASAIANT